MILIAIPMFEKHMKIRNGLLCQIMCDYMLYITMVEYIWIQTYKY